MLLIEFSTLFLLLCLAFLAGFALSPLYEFLKDRKKKAEHPGTPLPEEQSSGTFDKGSP